MTVYKEVAYLLCSLSIGTLQNFTANFEWKWSLEHCKWCVLFIDLMISLTVGLQVKKKKPVCSNVYFFGSYLQKTCDQLISRFSQLYLGKDAAMIVTGTYMEIINWDIRIFVRKLVKPAFGTTIRHCITPLLFEL